MFNKKNVIVGILALFVIGGFYTFFVFHDTINKSESQPSEDVLYKYTPDMQHISTYYGAEHFELIGDRTNGTPSCFPAVSKYSSYVYYKRNGTNERYLIVSWYFNDEKKFMQARLDLASYLKEHGTARTSSSSGLFIPSQNLEFGVTAYNSNTTSGRFVTYLRPFSADQTDYFIVYYGLMGMERTSEQNLALSKLMAEGYYNETGMVEPLLCDEEYFRPPGGWEKLGSGPGLPPPESMQVWYLPSPDYVSADFNVSAVEAILNDLAANGTCINETILAEHIPLEGVAVNETFAGHFSLIGERKAGVAPPFFPVLSQYCGYANYSRTGSDDQYLAGEWYFNDGEEFLRAEKELYQYLEEHGRVSTMELNISNGDVTKYECETTSGYFLVYKNTFGREGDYFIVYYGAVGPVDLSNQAPFLKALIADRYPTGSGVVGGLKS